MAVEGYMTVRFVRPWYSPDHVLYGRKERTQQIPLSFEELLPTDAVILDGGTGKHAKRANEARAERGLRPLNPEALEKLAEADTSPYDHGMIDEDGNVVVQRPGPNPPAEPGNNTKQPGPGEVTDANAKPSQSTEKDAKAKSVEKATR